MAEKKPQSPDPAERIRPIGIKLYDILVRLGGNRNSEARVVGCTAPEVILLHDIHGPDSIASCAPVLTEDGDHAQAEGPDGLRSDARERDRLVARYEERNPGRKGCVHRLFGPTTMPLPREVDTSAFRGGNGAPAAIDPRENIPDFSSMID